MEEFDILLIPNEADIREAWQDGYETALEAVRELLLGWPDPDTACELQRALRRL